MNSLMPYPFPTISLFVFKGSLAIRPPFFEQNCAAILSVKVTSQSILKAAAKSHSRAGFLYPPAVQISMPVAAGAAETLTDLGVAIDHWNLRDPSVRRAHRLPRKRAHPTRQRVRRSRGFGRNARERSYATYERRREG